MTGVTLLVVGFLTGAAPAAGTTGNCDIVGPIFGMERYIRCKSFQVEVYPSMPAALEKPALQQQARTAAANPESKEVAAMAELRVGSMKRMALRYLKPRLGDSSARDVGLLTTVPNGPKAVRMVHCWQGLEVGCIEYFGRVAKSLPDVSEKPPAKPTLAGKVLEVPAGCSRKGARQIACGQAELTWAPLYDGAPETLDQIDPMMRRGAFALGTFESTDRFCGVDGVDAMCRVATLTAADGAKSWLVYAFARVRGETNWFSCSTKADPRAGLPAPCGSLMVLKSAGE
jgi:hypothetical protein